VTENFREKRPAPHRALNSGLLLLYLSYVHIEDDWRLSGVRSPHGTPI